MVDTEQQDTDAYETLMAQLEFVQIPQLPAIGSEELLRKNLDQGYVVLSEAVLRKLEGAFGDKYLFGHYASTYQLGDSVLVTSIEAKSNEKEKEIGRFVLNGGVDARELKNATKFNKILLLKKNGGYDALMGNGETIKPARVMLAQDGAVLQLLTNNNMLSKPAEKKSFVDTLKKSLGKIVPKKKEEKITELK